MLLKCKISRGMFSGERSVRFQVGDVVWHTMQSAWMCFRASDKKQAIDVPEDEEYDGYAEIVRAGDSDSDTSWVRYWFAHGTEGQNGLPTVELRAQLLDESWRPESKRG